MISSCLEVHIFVPKDSRLFHLRQSLSYKVVILGLKSRRKENCQVHMMLILNACPIFKQVTFLYLLKDDISPLFLSHHQSSSLENIIKLITLLYMYKQYLFTVKFIIFINMFLLFNWYIICLRKMLDILDWYGHCMFLYLTTFHLVALFLGIS